MEYMPQCRLHRPRTIAAALDARRECPTARYVAGGTDLIVNIRRGMVATEALIDLTAIDEMARIDRDDATGGLRIGAAVTLAEVAANSEVRRDYRVVASAAKAVAGAIQRQAATVGGNLCLDTRCVFYNQSEWWRRSNDYCLKYRGEVCHVAPSGKHCFAAFSGDLAPALLVLGAEVDISGGDGARTVPLDHIYADDGAAHLLLGEGELLTAVRLPAADGVVADYSKARVRGSIDFPLAGVAVALKRSGDCLSHLRVAFTGTNSRPILIKGTESLLDAPLDDDAVLTLQRMLPKQMQPMSSTFTPAKYRRRVVSNLTKALARRLYREAEPAAPGR